MNNGEIIYSIGILSYNKEDVVLDTLKTIEYQMRRYGQGKKVQLLISDDASTDESVKVIEQWLAEKESLFWRVDRLFFRENGGTANAYTEIIKRMEGDRYLIIAADDLFPCNSIFDAMEKQDWDTVDYVLPFVYPFKGQCISDGLEDNRTVLMQMLTHDRRESILYPENLHAFAPIGIHLFTEGLIEYIKRFDLLEDASKWHYLRVNYHDLKGAVYKAPVILYRKSEQSVTSGNSKTLSRYQADLKRIYKDRADDFGWKYKLLTMGVIKGWKPVFCLNKWINHLIYLFERKKVAKLLREINDNYYEPNSIFLKAVCEGKSVESLMQIKVKNET